MANQKTVSVENDVARATTTLTDKMPTLPLNGPQGRRAIGPRVTFHFISDPWSSANTYEAYDVVQVEGASYVAIQPVPTGIQLDNTQYWFLWSEPNAQWAELLNRVNTFDGRITDNEKSITSSLIYTVKQAGAIGDGVTDDTDAFKSAVEYCIEHGYTLGINEGTFIITQPIQITSAIHICGISPKQSVIKYTGAGNAIQLTASSSDLQYNLRNSVFENFSLIGNEAKDANGLVIGSTTNTSSYQNVPEVVLNNVYVSQFNIGAYLEGYGHTLIGVTAYTCNIGIEITHPEQVMIINCWCEYCEEYGLGLNILKYAAKSYGHSCHVLGGSFQRGGIGIYARSVFELNISTYMELNTQYDILMGNPDKTDDTDAGCHNIDVKYNSGSFSGTDASAYLIATNFGTIQPNPSTNMGEVPIVKCSGYTSYITVVLNGGGLQSTNPVEFVQNAAQTCRAFYRNYLITIPESTNSLMQSDKYGKLGPGYLNNGNALILSLDDSAAYVSLTNAAHSRFAVSDGDNDDAPLFVIDNNPSAQYKRALFALDAVFTIDGTKYKLGKDADSNNAILTAV